MVGHSQAPPKLSYTKVRKKIMHTTHDKLKYVLGGRDSGEGEHFDVGELKPDS